MKAGDCDLCGNWDSSLIDGACRQCNGKYKPIIKDRPNMTDTSNELPDTVKANEG